MHLFYQQIVVGAGNGIGYAMLALSIVLVYTASQQLNFAQGELATFTLYFAWIGGVVFNNFLIGTIVGVIFAFSLGWLLYRLILSRFSKLDELTHLIVFIAILLILNGADGALYGYDIKAIPSLFPDGSFAALPLLPYSTVGNAGILFLIAITLYLLLYHTRLGLAMRAVSSNREAASLMSIRVSAIVGLAWGASLVTGFISALVVAPAVYLEPNMMFSFLIFGFIGALIGGITNPWGAIAGGLAIGILDALLATYVVNPQLKTATLLVIMILVLVISPNGIFGSSAVRRV